MATGIEMLAAMRVIEREFQDRRAHRGRAPVRYRRLERRQVREIILAAIRELRELEGGKAL